MDAITARQQQSTAITTSLSQAAKSMGSEKSALEISSDNPQEDSLKVSNEKLDLSDSAIKLSRSAPVTSSSKAVNIDNATQAQNQAKDILAKFQSNPVEAIRSHGNVSFGLTVKSLTG
ncbi:MAG: hypothetical protein LAC70_01815 [Methylovulum sp.]|nr:hypothetical protein [Methylovulum sp.]